MNQAESNNYEIQLAIHGLGIFAKACEVHLSEEEELLRIFIEIIQKVERLYILNPEQDDDIVQYLPTYINTIASIMGQLRDITDNQITCFQRVLIIMIRTFPYLSQLHHRMIIEAFISTLHQINKAKSNSIDQFIEIVIYQSIIWTCSHQYPLAIDDVDEVRRKKVSYNDYLPFWHGLFQMKKLSMYTTDFSNDNSSNLIIKKTYDEFIKSLFVLINKLNLNMKIKETNSGFTDPEKLFAMVQVNDYEIFLNVVDFYKSVLEHSEHMLFSKWVNMFIQQMILKSTKNPLMSGFYKLLAAGLKICVKLHYFDDYRSKESSVNCFESLQSFTKDMLWKMEQYNGDLQVSCLQVLLAIPSVVINDILMNCVPSFLTLFNIGRSYFDLADMGLDTLQRWKKELPQDRMILFLEPIVPAFDSYLRSKSLQQCDSKSVIKSRKTKQVLHKRKILLEAEPELLRLQKKVLTFVAELSNDLCYKFVSYGSNVEPAIHNRKCYLKIALPYENVSSVLYLDTLVPRVIELALYCSNRKIRMTACELLQAITALFLGTCKLQVAITRGYDAEVRCTVLWISIDF